MPRLFACTLVVAAACGSSNHAKPDSMPPPPDAPPGPPVAVVVAGDYAAGHPGIMSKVDPETKTVTMNVAPQGAVGDDPMLRELGGLLYIVNRADGNNVTILDGQTFAFVDQVATGAGSNPQDVAVMGNTLFVPTYTGKGVAVLTRGSLTIGTIDLSADDPDGKPNCISAVLVGTDLYVACELLDDMTFTPRGPGRVYVVDTGTMAIKHTVTMMNPNPLGVFATLPSGDLIIPTIDFSINGGCVEKITVGASPASAGCVVTNTQLKGYGQGLSVQGVGGDNVLWISVSVDLTHSNLQGYDIGLSALWGQPITPASELILSAAGCRDGVVAATDGTMGASGVRLYSGSTEATTAPLAIGLPTINENAVVCY
jgi:hypothetical protein